MITSLPESFRKQQIFVKRMDWFIWEIVEVQVGENYGDEQGWERIGLILSMRYMYINSNQNPVAKFGGSRRSTRSKGTFLRTASHDNEDNPNQFETNKKLLDEMENHSLS